MPSFQRFAGAPATDLDQLLGAVKLVERAGVARNRDQQIGRLRGEFEARDGGLHGVEGPAEQFNETGLVHVGFRCARDAVPPADRPVPVR